MPCRAGCTCHNHTHPAVNQTSSHLSVSLFVLCVQAASVTGSELVPLSSNKRSSSVARPNNNKKKQSIWM